MQKVLREVAEQEVQSWLDYKKVSDSRREEKAEQIKALVNAIADGQVILNEDYTLTQVLLSEVGVEVKIKELTFKARLSGAQIQTYLQGVKPTDIDGRLYGYIAALTGQPKEVVRNLDTEDLTVAQNIAFFSCRRPNNRWVDKNIN